MTDSRLLCKWPHSPERLARVTAGLPADTSEFCEARTSHKSPDNRPYGIYSHITVGIYSHITADSPAGCQVLC